MKHSLRHGLYLVAEILLRGLINPRLRAHALKLLGAEIGANVRVYDCRFINLENGFKHLSLGDDVHVGTDCLIDLKAAVRIGNGSVLSPRVVIISHSDPGSSHGSPLAVQFAPESAGVEIGNFCWLGANATVLSGSRIADEVVVGAAALVRGTLARHGVYVGVPARAKGPSVMRRGVADG